MSTILLTKLPTSPELDWARKGKTKPNWYVTGICASCSNLQNISPMDHTIWIREVTPRVSGTSAFFFEKVPLCATQLLNHQKLSAALQSVGGFLCSVE
jgi:hypothetical protein